MDETNMFEEHSLEDVVAEAIKPKLQEQFNYGVIAGYNAAVAILYNKINSLTNVKDIKRLLRAELKNTHLPEEIIEKIT